MPNVYNRLIAWNLSRITWNYREDCQCPFMSFMTTQMGKEGTICKIRIIIFKKISIIIWPELIVFNCILCSNICMSKQANAKKILKWFSRKCRCVLLGTWCSMNYQNFNLNRYKAILFVTGGTFAHLLEVFYIW